MWAGKLVELLAEHPHVQIVLSTSWALPFEQVLRAALKEALDASPEIIAVAPCRQDESSDCLFKRARHLLNAGFSRVILDPYLPKHECFELHDPAKFEIKDGQLSCSRGRGVRPIYTPGNSKVR